MYFFQQKRKKNKSSTSQSLERTGGVDVSSAVDGTKTLSSGGATPTVTPPDSKDKKVSSGAYKGKERSTVVYVLVMYITPTLLEVSNLQFQARGRWTVNRILPE